MKTPIYLNEINLTDIGRIVRFHRKKSGLNRIELARLAGVGKTVIFDIEHAKTTIRLNTLFQVFTVLNIKVILDSPLMKLYSQEINEDL